MLSSLMPLSAQVEGVTRKAMTIHKRPLSRVPVLAIEEGSIRFEDSNQNGKLDADERATVFFTLENAPTATGQAQDVVCDVRLEGASFGVDVPETIHLGNIPVGSSTVFSIPVSTGMNTKDGELQLYLKVRDRFGVGTRESLVELETLAFRAPEVEVSYRQVKQGVVERRIPFDYEFVVQNSGEGFAYDVRCELEFVDQGVNPISQHTWKFDRMAPGEYRELTVGLMVQDDFPHEEVRFNVLLVESFDRYATTFVEALPIGAPIEQVYRPRSSTVVSGKASGPTMLKGGVDYEVPQLRKAHPNRFALLIGNEDYTSQNASLEASQDVPYAVRDAEVMREYFVGLWGVPAENIILETNATKATMEKALKRLANFAKAFGPEAELFFYYSGHGLPSEETKEPFLIPVDLDGGNPELGIALEQVYGTLGEQEVARTTIFLDACFSGGARDGRLIAGMKGLTRAPAEVEAGARTVVFASSSGDQSSGVFEEQEHGYFTYFLLKYMQEAKGKLNYGEMYDYVRREVMLEANREKGGSAHKQEPAVSVAPSIINNWRSWGLDD